MTLYQYCDGNYSTISGNYRKIIFLSTLLLLTNCVHIRYKFAGLSEVPTQFTDSNSNTGAPVLTFPGGADNPTVVTQGLMLDSNKHLVMSTHFETSTNQYSFGVWVFFYEKDSIRYISGINAGASGLVIEGQLYSDTTGSNAEFDYMKLNIATNKKGWNRIGFSYDMDSYILEGYMYNPIDGNLPGSDSVLNATFNVYKLGCFDTCGNTYILYSFEFRDDITLGDSGNTNFFGNPYDTCGDSIVQSGHLEECDDGGHINSDGCDEACFFDTGSCSVTPISCTTEVSTPACGDGAVDSTEACDDGNTDGSDGCDATCNIEPGYSCVNSPAPSVCTVPTSSSSSTCNVESCTQCDENNSNKCAQCQSGYKLASNGKCVTPNIVVMTPYGESVADSAKYSSISGAVVASVVPLFSCDPPTILWSIINQDQIMQLFVLIDGYMPDDVQGILSGEGGIPINAGFIPTAEVPFIDEFADWIDMEQTEPALEIIGVESGSSINNSISFMLTVLCYTVLHLILFCSPNCKPKNETQKMRKLYWSIKSNLLSLFMLTIYIRSFYETFQFLALAGLSATWNNDKNEKDLNISSFIFAIVLLFLCTGFFLWSLYHYFGSRSDNPRNLKISQEFTNGAKENNSGKLYPVLGLLRRGLLCSWMIFASSFGAVVHMVGLLYIQAPYLLYILTVRPLDGHQENLVECVNEIFFTLTAVFLAFCNTEAAWSRGLEVVFMNYLLAHSIIIVLISITGLVVLLVRWICKKLKGRKDTDDEEPPSQRIRIISQNSEQELQRNSESQSNKLVLYSVSELDSPQVDKLEEESKE